VILSNVFIRHKVPQPRFAPAVFLGLFAFFILIGETRPLIALVGLGTIAIIFGAIVEVNRERIWETYKKAYKKPKGLKGVMTRPDPFFYLVNVYFLWPLIIVLGVLCITAAYLLS
jgi:hypothetical protein